VRLRIGKHPVCETEFWVQKYGVKKKKEKKKRKKEKKRSGSGLLVFQ